MSRYKTAQFAVRDDDAFWVWLTPKDNNAFVVELSNDVETATLGVLVEDTTVEKNDPAGRWSAFLARGDAAADIRHGFIQQGRAIDWLIDQSGWRDEQAA